MIDVLFYAVKQSRANEPQKNPQVLLRASEGPILAHDDFLLMLCDKKVWPKYFYHLLGKRCLGICDSCYNFCALIA
jgi:hypothetical protein